mgnify:CR=1 FL=1
MSAIKRHIQKKKSDFSIKDYGFYDISKGELANMIKSSAILLYSEPDSFITSLTNNEMKIYDISQEVFSCAVYPGDPKPERQGLSATAAGDLYNLTGL